MSFLSHSLEVSLEEISAQLAVGLRWESGLHPLEFGPFDVFVVLTISRQVECVVWSTLWQLSAMIHVGPLLGHKGSKWRYRKHVVIVKRGQVGLQTRQGCGERTRIAQ